MKKTSKYLTEANFSINDNYVFLTGIKDSDYEILYRFETEPEFNLFCLNRLNPIKGLDDYKRRFEKVYTKQRQLQFLIRDVQGNAVGTIFSSRKGIVHGNSNFCIFLEENARSRIIGWYALTLFFRYMFEKRYLIKLYTEVMDDNILSIRCAKSFGLVEEGYYPNHYKRIDGNHIGVHILAFYPSTIDERPKMYRTHRPYTVSTQ